MFAIGWSVRHNVSPPRRGVGRAHSSRQRVYSTGGVLSPCCLPQHLQDLFILHCDSCYPAVEFTRTVEAMWSLPRSWVHLSHQQVYSAGRVPLPLTLALTSIPPEPPHPISWWLLIASPGTSPHLLCCSLSPDEAPGTVPELSCLFSLNECTQMSPILHVHRFTTWQVCSLLSQCSLGMGEISTSRVSSALEHIWRVGWVPSSLEDEKILGESLRPLGDITGVTGDSAKDALALKTASIRLSMGITSTEVPKEASETILVDDSFALTVKVIMRGRCVNNTVCKFLQFQIFTNITAAVITFISTIAWLVTRV